MHTPGTGEVGIAPDSAAIVSLWSLPFAMVRLMHDFEIDSMHAWARSVWGHDHVHPHEPATQLEIPDPIAEAPEQDLFA